MKRPSKPSKHPNETINPSHFPPTLRLYLPIIQTFPPAIIKTPRNNDGNINEVEGRRRAKSYNQCPNHIYRLKTMEKVTTRRERPHNLPNPN
jgi:hypothetical protein